eukprot:CAMPEP_0184288250 /NCGR_PEP_ID=MMETSP1049-20130417/755_1 /TAXON_ID=77928 /ORGANISM="Proteomonas sulcata, Strain CCMP704" /LENGTH=168 /DNA_ID=CAMNT_0026594529 /DNA_START=243 /DNA_END=749 /DNA_ORIENTATION=-
MSAVVACRVELMGQGSLAASVQELKNRESPLWAQTGSPKSGCKSTLPASLQDLTLHNCPDPELEDLLLAFNAPSNSNAHRQADQAEALVPTAGVSGQEGTGADINQEASRTKSISDRPTNIEPKESSRVSMPTRLGLRGRGADGRGGIKRPSAHGGWTEASETVLHEP